MQISYTNTTDTATFFDYAQQHRLALFPLRADTKTPACENGFYDATTSAADWHTWRAQGHQLGISACLSGLVLIDVDAHGDRDQAWAQFAAWCAEIGLELPVPYGHSPNGGWHFAFQCPTDFDPHKHRGHESIKVSHFRTLRSGEEDRERISIRNRAYNVAPGSQFGGRPYLLAADAPPPIDYSEKTAPLFALLKRVGSGSITGLVPNAVGGVSHDGVRYDQLIWWISKKVERWTSGAEKLGNDEWISIGKRIKLSFPGDDGLKAFLAMSWEDQHDTVTRRWWNPGDFKTEGENLETLPALLKRDTTWMFGSALGCPQPARCPVSFPIPAEILEQHRREREQYQAALLGPLPDHPELPIDQANALNHYWAHLPSGRMIYERTGELFNSASVDKHIGRVKDAMKTEGPGALASTWLSQHRFVKSMGWAPGEPKIIEDRVLTNDGWIRSRGDRTFNRYVPPHVEHIEGDVSKWLRHVEAIYPGEAEHIVMWLAHRVQRPGEKVNHALVFIGSQGIGKDTILKPAITAIGPQNFKQITAKTFFNSEWNDYLQSVILRINEAHDLGGESRYGFYDATKDVITNPPEAHRINTKHVPQYAAANVCGVVMTSNHLDALYLAPDDRRHFVCVSTRTQEDFTPAYWDDINNWFENGGNEAVAHYLAHLDLAAFNAKAPPRKTAAWHMVVAAGVAPESGDLSDVIESMGKPDALTLQMVKARTPGDSQLRLLFEDAKLRRAIPKRLAECGYVAVTNPEARDSGGRWRMPGCKTTIYARQELTEDGRLAAARLLSATAEVSPPIPLRQ
ncbi:bifunctional DNA primase/polymerase [Bradyrhizobium sp. 166]|uniref:bifunctional DNA primase/polymerase n=1 Tax=Bradyrhizobium sp. 166 TaxID=2782638 RepID=UPI001FF9CCD6|nr:bifunctional DNA primase/polymerase [Bradyrhizobium sp. 166]MCK1601051.1 bifunctional DNA primase/polymerase [Bradyrhizobium sp. 166]